MITGVEHLITKWNCGFTSRVQGGYNFEWRAVDFQAPTCDWIELYCL